MNDDPREPISLVAETPDTVTLRRTDYEALLSELEDAEDRAAVLEHRLAKAAGTATETLSLEEATLLIEGENPVKFWREKRGLSQQSLASAAEISKSLAVGDRERHEDRERRDATQAVPRAEGRSQHAGAVTRMRELHIFQDTNVVLQEWRVEKTYGESGLPCRKQT